VPAKVGGGGSDRSPVPHSIESTTHVRGGRLIDFDIPSAGSAIAIRQSAALRAGTGAALCLGASASRHAGNDDTTVVRSYGVPDAVEEHPGRIARPVAVRAIGVQDSYTCVSERPEGIMCRELVASQPGALFHKQYSGPVLKTLGQGFAQGRAVTHGQRP